MDSKLKHLDFVQGVINRLSTNSFLLKGWSVILVAALFALSASESNTRFALLALVPALVFWGLDGYFLALERTYRKHYENIRKKSPDEIDFSMNINYLKQGFKAWWRGTRSKTLISFHGSIISAIVVVIYIQGW